MRDLGGRWAAARAAARRATSGRRRRAAGRVGARPGRGREPGTRRGAGPSADERAERSERVVGDLAGPDEVPQRGEHHAFVGGARPPHEVGPERRAAPVRGARGSRRGADRSAARPGGGGARSRTWSRKKSATRPSSAPSAPAPIHTTSPLAHSSSRSAGRYPWTRAGSTSGSRTDAGIATPCSCSIASTSASGPRRGGRRPATRAGTGRASSASTGSTSLPQRGEGAAPEPAQHLDVAPLALDAAAGRNSPWTTRPLGLERVERGPRRDPRRRPSRAATSAGENGPCVRA